VKIVFRQEYDGAMERLDRLALRPLLAEVEQIITTPQVYLLESRNANSAKVVRQKLDEEFSKKEGWVQRRVGGIDWKKTSQQGEAELSIGVEIQVSARSDLVIRDLVHIGKSLRAGVVDVCIIVVPSDRMQTFLTDRTPNVSTTKNYIEDDYKDAQDFPLLLWGIEHDGKSSTSLPKR